MEEQSPTTPLEPVYKRSLLDKTEKKSEWRSMDVRSEEV